MSTVGYVFAFRLNNFSGGDWLFLSPVHGVMAPKRAKLSPAAQNQNSKEVKSTESPAESLTETSSATAESTAAIPVQPAVDEEDLADREALMEVASDIPVDLFESAMPANSEVLPKQQPPDHSSATVESAIAVQPVVCEKTCSQDVADQTARGQNDISVAGTVAKSCSPRIDAPAVSSPVGLIGDTKPSLSMLSRRAMPVVHEDSRPASVITEPSVSGPVVDLDLPLIRRAASFRIKYRRHEQLLRLPIEQVGFHPKNRDGQPPNGERCCQLAEDIARLGFDRDEADAGGVVVEQRPSFTTIADFNQKACELDPYHAPAIAGCISFGSLSHSHLHQVLKNIRAGMAGTVTSILDSSGHYSLVMLRNVDPMFASAVDGGLLWEVLSWKMEQEEPDACVITQVELNSKGALLMISH